MATHLLSWAHRIPVQGNHYDNHIAYIQALRDISGIGALLKYGGVIIEVKYRDDNSSINSSFGVIQLSRLRERGSTT